MGKNCTETELCNVLGGKLGEGWGHKRRWHFYICRASIHHPSVCLKLIYKTMLMFRVVRRSVSSTSLRCKNETIVNSL